MQYEENDNEFIDSLEKDMQAFEAKYPGVHLVVEVAEDTNGFFRVEHEQVELYFEKYEDMIRHLKIYD